MDSISQLALGAAVSVAVMGRRTAVWKAALWGGIAGTLPDLDALHRPWRRDPQHGAAPRRKPCPVLADAVVAAAGRRRRARCTARRRGSRRWWLALWLALVTHPLLDAMTVYGTQLLLPFTDHPFGVGSIFIIDPLYTLPLLVGAGWALALARQRAADCAGQCAGRWCCRTAYLGWGMVGAAARASAGAAHRWPRAGHRRRSACW